jgi:hypothetical protein
MKKRTLYYPTPPYLRHVLDTGRDELPDQAQARADRRRRRELLDLFSPIVGILHGVLFAVAVWAALGSFVVWWLS